MIPERAIQLLSKKGFIDAYYEGVRAGMSCKDAFESVNLEHELFFGKPRYMSYDSFRHVRDYKVTTIQK